MDKKIKVSIVTVCFNSEVTIRDTIEHVLRQTYKNIEYIIVDGRSSDGTVGIIKDYLPLFKGRLKYISEKDKGIYDAMNKGIRLSSGGLIGIINSDDFYEEQAVEKAVAHLGKERYQVVYGYCNLLRGNRVRGVIKNCHRNLEQIMIPHPACFVTRQTYRDFGLFSSFFKIAADYELMLRLYKSGQVVFTQIPEVIADFRDGGISTKPGMEKWRQLEKMLIQYHYRSGKLCWKIRKRH